MVFHHTFNSHECIGVSGEALQLHSVYKKRYFLLQVTQEFVSVLATSHVKICISITSHMRVHIGYCKSRAQRLNMQ